MSATAGRKRRYSGPTQPQLPLSPAGRTRGPAANDNLGAADLWIAAAEEMAPRGKMTPFEFGRDHRVYTKEGKSDRWQADETPWAEKILWALSEESPYRRIVVPKGTQLGLTEIGLIWTGQGILAGESTLIIEPTEALARKIVRTKFRPMLMTTTILAGYFAGRAADTSLHFSAPSVDVMFAGSNSPANFAGVTVRRFFCDEVDRCAAELPDEGDLIDIGENRIAEYGFLGKAFYPCSPTVDGASLVWREWLASDRRHYECPCPRCGVLMDWTWEDLEWIEGRPDTVMMKCRDCGEKSAEFEWKAIWGKGSWRATNLNPARADTIGFHLSTLYARLGQRTWAQLVQEFEIVKASGLSGRLQSFWNTKLGLPWKVTEDAVPVEHLRARLEEGRDKGVLPPGVLTVTAGVDYQKSGGNRAEIQVWGWGRKRESWLIDKIVVTRLNADGTKRPSAEIAAEMKARAFEVDWPHECGGALRIERHVHDTGDDPADVFEILNHFKASEACGSKGREGWGERLNFLQPKTIDVYRDGKKVQHGRQLFPINTAPAKQVWYDDLRRAPNTEGGISENYVHLPAWIDEEQGYLDQFVAEEIRKNSRNKLYWHKLGPNEGMDCRIMADGARHLLRTHRWTESEWSRREALVRRERPKDPPPSATGAAAKTKTRNRAVGRFGG